MDSKNESETTNDTAAEKALPPDNEEISSLESGMNLGIATIGQKLGGDKHVAEAIETLEEGNSKLIRALEKLGYKGRW